MSFKKFIQSVEEKSNKKKTSKSFSWSKYKKPVKILFTIILVLILGSSIILYKYFDLPKNLLLIGTIIPGFFLMVMYLGGVDDTDFHDPTSGD